jgi:UDP-N-acetylmuramoyl-L-alanyl-D-glutamate--2,6-diaminopimelate ligase
VATIWYRFPSRQIVVIGVTGTKGKSSVCEMLAHILETAGTRVALTSTIHFRIAGIEEPNRFKMSMPGRFFMQQFLRRAVTAGCTYAVLEMTSEGAKLWRHAGISMNALIFTNLTPEHIESHGSFEKYRDAKLRLRDALSFSSKHPKAIISNLDDEYGLLFMNARGAQHIGYRLTDGTPYHANEAGISFTWEGHTISSSLKGAFVIRNMLAAAHAAKWLNIDTATIVQALSSLSVIRGRGEEIKAGQPFPVVVDYAHTAESLEALYTAYAPARRICVLGNTGGGRDRWKRPKMGAIAEHYCSDVILTNEDPYDEDPRAIIDEMVAGMQQPPTIIMDRRAAIKEAIRRADAASAVLITGKGTDPFIMEKGGTKIPWDDATVAREILREMYPPTTQESMR